MAYLYFLLGLIVGGFLVTIIWMKKAVGVIQLIPSGKSSEGDRMHLTIDDSSKLRNKKFIVFKVNSH